MKHFKKRRVLVQPTFENTNTVNGSLFDWDSSIFEDQQTFKNIQDVLNENKRIHDILVSVGYVFEIGSICDKGFGAYTQLNFRSNDLGNRQTAYISWLNEQQLYPEVTLCHMVSLQEPSKGKEYAVLEVSNLYGDSINETDLLRYKNMLHAMSLVKK